MNNDKKVTSRSQDELLKTKKGDIELSDSELGGVSGGFLKIDGIEGESQDAKHKDEIHIESF